MSRLIAMIVVVLCLAPPAQAQKAESPHAQIMQMLQETLDMKQFQDAMTFKDFLGLISDAMLRKGKELNIQVDVAAFRDEMDMMFLQQQLQFEFLPRSVKAGVLLKRALDLLPNRPAAFLIRNGQLEITTRSRATLDHLVQQSVTGNYRKMTLEQVLEDLSEQTGVSLTLDQRVKEKAAQLPITATFRNDVTLEGAVRMLADMAGLKVVDMRSGLYLTTPENAKELEKENEERPQRGSGVAGA